MTEYKLIAQGGQDVFDGLGHDDQPHALHPGHTQAAGSFLLSRVHCLDTSADDLGDIDAGVKGDGQNHSVGGG